MRIKHSVLAGRKWVFALLVMIPVMVDIVAAPAFRTGSWAYLIAGLYYVCIVIAGIEFGWKAGLALAAIAGIAHSMIERLMLGSTFTQLGAQALAFLVVGLALVGRRKSPAETVKPATRSDASGRPVSADEYLEQVSTTVRELLREVSTPVGSIEGAAYILENDRSPEKREEFIGIIVTECRRVHAILSELKDSTEVIPLACCPTDASSMLGEVIRLAALEEPDPNISLRIEVASDLPPLWCDPARIEQTMIPFVTSVIRAMRGGGEILLAADRQNGLARIQMRILGQTVRGSDPSTGRGSYSSTFDAAAGVRVLAARRTVLQHGGTITLDQTGHLKRLLSLTLPLYNATS